jgi:hypothetical protein
MGRINLSLTEEDVETIMKGLDTLRRTQIHIFDPKIVNEIFEKVQRAGCSTCVSLQFQHLHFC